MGFCFLPEKVVCTRKESFDIKEHRWITAKSIVTPEYAWRFLEGIVDDDVLVEFEAPEELLQKTVGMYADYDDHKKKLHYCFGKRNGTCFQELFFCFK